MKFIIMKKTVFTIMIMLFISIACFGNEVVKYLQPIKLENISEAYINIPANVYLYNTLSADSSEFVRIKSEDKYLLKHLTYKIEGNKITFNSDVFLDEIYDYRYNNDENPLNICIYSPKSVQIKTDKRDLLIIQKNNKVLTNEK